MTTATYYFDGSVSTDAGSWTNFANAYDGSTITFASGTATAGIIRGTTAPSTHQGTITKVEVRFWGESTSGSNTNVEIRHGGTSSGLGAILNAPATSGWTSYTTLDPNDITGTGTPQQKGWTWATLADLAARVVAPASSSGDVNRIEIRVTYYADAANSPNILGWTFNDSAGSTVTSLPIGFPQGTESGDLLILIGASDADNASGAVLSVNTGTYPGWTKINEYGDGTSDTHIAAWWKIATASGGTVAFDSSASDELIAWCFRITGHDSTTPIDSHTGNAQGNSGTYWIQRSTSPQLTTTADNCLCIGAVASDGSDAFGNVTARPIAWDGFEPETVPENGGNDVGGGAAYTHQATAGTPAAASYSSSTSDGSAHIVIGIAPGAGAYELDANSGSYTLTGSAADFEVTMEANAGSYTYTGSAANFKLGKTMGAESGSYTITGEAVDFDISMEADAGSYSLTGEPVNFLLGYQLDSESGSYTYTGSAADFALGKTLSASQDFVSTIYWDGNINVLDNDNAWTNEANAADGSTATYAETTSTGTQSTNEIQLQGINDLLAAYAGHDIVQIRGRIYYDISGTGTTTLEADMFIDFNDWDKNSFSLSDAGPGWSPWQTFTQLAAGPITLPIKDYSLDPVVATYCRFWAESTGTLTYLRVYRVELEVTYRSSQYVYTGSDADLTVDRLLESEAGSYTLTGSDVDFKLGVTLAAEAGSYLLNGGDAGLYAHRLLETSEHAVTAAAAFTDGAEDNTKQWTDDANAYDGSTSTYAYTTSEGYVNTDYSSAPWPVFSGVWSASFSLDTAIPTGGSGRIAKVEYRSYIQVTGTGTPQMEVTIRDLNTPASNHIPFTQQDYFTQTTAGWTDWTEVTPSPSGWGDWGAWGADGLIRLYFAAQDGTGTLTEGRLYKAELRVTYSDAVYQVSFDGPIVAYNRNDFQAESGSYTYTGSDAAFDVTLTMPAESGSYSLTGSAADFTNDWVLPAESGSYSVTGSDVDFKTAGDLKAESGSYTYTGSDAALEAAFHLDAESGSYSLTGSDVNFPQGFYLGAESGSYSVTGSDSDLDLSAVVKAEAGSYAYTGFDVNFPTEGELDAEAGSYSIIGSDVAFARGYIIGAESGSYTTTGSAAEFALGEVLSAEAGSYAVTGADANLNASLITGRRVIMIG